MQLEKFSQAENDSITFFVKQSYIDLYRFFSLEYPIYMWENLTITVWNKTMKDQNNIS